MEDSHLRQCPTSYSPYKNAIYAAVSLGILPVCYTSWTLGTVKIHFKDGVTAETIWLAWTVSPNLFVKGINQADCN